MIKTDKWKGDYVKDSSLTKEQIKIKYAFARQLLDADLKDITKALESLLKDMYEQMQQSRWLITLNTFEVGFLTSFVWDNKDERSDRVLTNFFKQLTSIQKKIREAAGVKVKKLPNRMLQMTSKDGTTIVRERYPWENY